MTSTINYLWTDRLGQVCWGALLVLQGNTYSSSVVLNSQPLFIISMTNSSSSTTKYVDLLMKFAALAVIPLIAWVISLEVANAERDFQLQVLYQRIDSLEEVNTTVQEYAVRLGQVDQKLESMEDTVDEIRQDIKDLLRREE